MIRAYNLFDSLYWQKVSFLLEKPPWAETISTGRESKQGERLPETAKR
jgi:hypothetical protein